MDKDDLFDDFETENNNNNLTNNNENTLTKNKLDESKNDFLNKKRANTLPGKNSVEKPKNKDNQEQIEDITFQKSVHKILNDKLPSENPLNPETELKITTYTFTGGVHETIYPKTCPIEPLKEPSTPPATTYPFTLDPFQSRSILCLENRQSVLVAAHTSAGKTVVAQYAIAMSLRDHQRVIYTSPIKALSNQKYRELAQQFKDVGLMTGDVTINSNASCIVMTTEILRNMLYKGSEITKEIAWVIFDEVHYMRDKARGVVWEETMILLSNKINYVFLSATIPNAREFAMWICKLKSQPCNVVYTDFRPVPLQHYVYPSGSDTIYLAVDDKGNFKEDNFNKALSTFSENILDKNDKGKMNKKDKTEDDIKKIVELINDQNLNPAIVFSFSKIECEELAYSLSKIDLTTDDEKELIENIYTNAIMTLSTEDQALPQIEKMLPILKKGVGVHHGGMLPIVRECVELIFQEGLIKTLFSTETFSMGVNMPAKTVVFTNLEKFDGNEHRFVTGGEFIQMSGRAGRRGLDEKGITILMLKKKMEPEKIREILSGQSDPLNSSFSLSYNQIVNLSRIEGVKCEYILKRSFRQFQAERAVPIIKEKIKKMFNEYQNYDFNWERDDLVKNIIITKETVSVLKEKNRNIINQPKNILRFLTPGRIVHIKNWGIGIVLNFTKKNVEKISKYNEKKETYELVKYENSNNTSDINNNRMIELYIVDLVVYLKKGDKEGNKLFSGDVIKKNGKIAIIPFLLSTFEGVSPIKINLPKNLKDNTSLLSLEKTLFEITSKFKSKIPKIDPIKEMSINDPELKSNNAQLTTLHSALLNYESTLLSKFGNDITQKEISDQLISSYKSKITLRTQIKHLIQELNMTNKLILQEDLANMKRVLRRLGYIENEVVTLKGQVACCISSADEILLTEMLFNGAFNSLDENSISSILSCFLATEGTGFPEERKKAEENSYMSSLHEIIKQNAEREADVLIECKLPVDKDSFIKSFKMEYMLPLLHWTQGEKTFGDICKDTKIYEGSIIRVIRRLDELLKELGESARLLGNTNLNQLFENTSKKIQRGIPFAASLYLSN